MQVFSTIGLTGKPDDAGVSDTIQRIADHLHGRGCTVIIDGRTVPAHVAADCERTGTTPIAERVDLLVAIGGDGTLLTAAHEVAGSEVPILGVNRGRLGFLVDVSPGDFAEIDKVLEGQYTADDRMMLSAELRDGEGRVLDAGIALNDVVLHKWHTARMIEFETWIDGQLCNQYRSDGLIISTPTGSTAYAMSGGGPILHPDVDAMALVPICPHTLSNRPLVIGAGSHIEIRMPGTQMAQIRLSCDSQKNLEPVPGASVHIRRHDAPVHLLHPPGYQYFDILRAKLRWGDGHPV
ncbi:NAD kinase [wastewater metagenome]|uniref:NAD kinase n=2 Tax=unclassified sequences TaxID=12908 RepID=A0A5B8RBD7_9ZZZZ|nr:MULTISPECIES: NAD(+) kinase [Arhodomonas]MCS4505470.1 NAD(+) kinase [Arhodomonas aquaeolei]QEA06120.1 NAD kinase [uncultured organism]